MCTSNARACLYGTHVLELSAPEKKKVSDARAIQPSGRKSKAVVTQWSEMMAHSDGLRQASRAGAWCDVGRLRECAGLRGGGCNVELESISLSS